MEYYVFGTDEGWVAVLGSDRGLVGLTLPQPSKKAVLKSLGGAMEGVAWAPARFKDLARRIKGYFGGDEVSFPDGLDLSAATPFQRAVWQAARLIPYGETRSYGWLAEKVGRPGAGRAVGQALSKNRLPIIVPCHRVIGSDGSLGGFSGGLGVKERLLRLEAAAISRQR